MFTIFCFAAIIFIAHELILFYNAGVPVPAFDSTFFLWVYFTYGFIGLFTPAWIFFLLSFILELCTDFLKEYVNSRVVDRLNAGLSLICLINIMLFPMHYL